MNKNAYNFFQYERGSKVDFLGNTKYKPFKGTYIWGILRDDEYSVAYIQHPEGLLKRDFEAKVPFKKDAQPIPDSHFDPLEKYIEVTEQEIVFSDIVKRQNRDNEIRENILFLQSKLSR